MFVPFSETGCVSRMVATCAFFGHQSSRQKSHQKNLKSHEAPGCWHIMTHKTKFKLKKLCGCVALNCFGWYLSLLCLGTPGLPYTCSFLGIEKVETLGKSGQLGFCRLFFALPVFAFESFNPFHTLPSKQIFTPPRFLCLMPTSKDRILPLRWELFAVRGAVWGWNLHHFLPIYQII